MINKKYIYGAFGIAALLFFIYAAGSIFENVDAKEIVVIQAPFSGDLNPIIVAGTKWQGFGTVTRYKKSFQLWFTADKGKDGTGPIKVRFNDGGHGDISGSIRVDMPLDPESIVRLHTTYGSQEAIETQLIGQVISKAVYMTGPMMSSKESYAERRTDLLSFIEDQAINGIYKTITVNQKIKDPMDTMTERTVAVVQIRLDEKTGLPMRQEVSPTQRFNIKLYGLAINAIDYDQIVEKQIAAQQSAVMQVQTAIANAKRAEQEKFTVEQQGMADAAKAKWDQEVIKAQAVTEAQQRLEVARLNKETEEQNKLALTLKGEGEASYKRAVTQANNNLEIRMDAWVKERQAAWAAFAEFKGNMVPLYVTGGAAGGGQSNAADWMQLMGVKASMDLLKLSEQK